MTLTAFPQNTSSENANTAQGLNDAQRLMMHAIRSVGPLVLIRLTSFRNKNFTPQVSPFPLLWSHTKLALGAIFLDHSLIKPLMDRAARHQRNH